MDSRKIIAQYYLMHWSQLIAERKESGLTVREFCENAGIRENTYYYWQKKLRDETCERFMINRADEPLDTSHKIPVSFTEVKLQDVPIVPVLESRTITAVSKTDPISAPISAPMITANDTPASNTGQIRIDAKGCQIIVDSTYPIDKLTLLLQELMRS